jgi:hypothetical protein
MAPAAEGWLAVTTGELATIVLRHLGFGVGADAYNMTDQLISKAEHTTELDRRTVCRRRGLRS